MSILLLTKSRIADIVDIKKVAFGLTWLLTVLRKGKLWNKRH